MRTSKVVDLVTEVSLLNEGQVSDVIGYVAHLKAVEELAQEKVRTVAMAEIRSALKRGYSF